MSLDRVELFLIRHYFDQTGLIDLVIPLLILNCCQLDLFLHLFDICLDHFVLLLNVAIEHLDLIADIVVLHFVLVDIQHQLFPSILELLHAHIHVLRFESEVRLFTL